MARVRQFAAALVAAVLALVAAVLGVLSLTVWKPAGQVVATTTPDRPYVMTRDKVLPLLAQDVTVTVTAPDDEEVSLVYGTTGDVLGWIGDSPYTEVIGIASGMTSLLTVDHPGTGGSAQPGGDAQSGEGTQSGDGAESGDDAQSGDGAQSGATPAGNDMWLQQATGKGTTSLTLTGVQAGQSVLAAVDGTADAPQITLTWSVHQTNAAAVVSFALAAVLAVFAALFFASELRTLRHRRRRARRLAERAGADATETQVIPLDQVREMAEEHGDGEDDGAPGDTGARADTGDRGTTGDHSAAEDHAGAPGSGAPADAEVVRKPVIGRHGDAGAPVDLAPDGSREGDSGIIDVSGIREGMAFPTRRALREAREKGQHRVVIDGREFDTGLIPVVGDGSGRPHPEGGPEDRDADPSAPGGGQDGGARGSWTSLVAGWTHGKKEDDDETDS